MFAIRQVLAVPESYRATPIRRRPFRHNTSAVDSWAQKRAKELTNAGTPATTRRYRKKEPLCVVYKID